MTSLASKRASSCCSGGVPAAGALDGEDTVATEQPINSPLDAEALAKETPLSAEGLCVGGMSAEVWQSPDERGSTDVTEAR